MYMRGLEVAASGAAEVLARMAPAYFDRRWEHFCSHRQTPCSGELAGPAATRAGDVIYFAHPIFGQYHQKRAALVQDAAAERAGDAIARPAATA